MTAYLRAYDELTACLRAAADFDELLLQGLDGQREATLSGFEPGDLLKALRRHRLKSLDCLVAGVHLELAAGRSWPQVANGLGLPEELARQMYEPGYTRWLGGPAASRRDGTASALVPLGRALAKIATWWLRRRRGVPSGGSTSR